MFEGKRIHRETIMKCKTVLLLLSVFVGIGGCVTDPRAVRDPDHSDVGVGPIFVEAVTLDNASIRLRWIQTESVETFISYRVTWEPLNTDHYTDIDFGTHYIDWTDGIPFEEDERAYMTDIGPLTPGQFYVFHVFAKRAGEQEEDIVNSIQASPAQWFHRDAARPDERLRIYEQGSTLGSGLVLDPALGGPTRVTPETARPGSVQLALVTMETALGPGWYIQSASKSTEYAVPGLADRTTLVSSTRSILDDLAGPLDTWFLREGEFEKVKNALSQSNTIFLTAEYPQLTYRGEIICFGTGADFIGTRRFARIVAVSQDDGVMIRGTAPNRYVEVDITIGYPGIPWA